MPTSSTPTGMPPIAVTEPTISSVSCARTAAPPLVHLVHDLQELRIEVSERGTRERLEHALVHGRGAGAEQQARLDVQRGPGARIAPGGRHDGRGHVEI